MRWGEKYSGDNLWTNNNCESAKNLLKLKIDWKPARLLDLVHHLHDLVRLQFADIERALFEQGNLQLVSPFNRHKVSHSRWQQASRARRQIIFSALMSDRGKQRADKTVTSTDGELTVQASPRVARKPVQRKRARAERTQ